MAQPLVLELHIDVVSDVICPWCFLGKRRLEKAISLVPDIAVEVTYRPFFLDPTLPPEGMDRRTYLVNKFGEGRLKTLHDPLIAAGKADGVHYHFERITRSPNTLNAHRLLRWSLLAGVQAAVKEALMLAYFSEGKDVGATPVLAAIAAAAGMDGEQVAKDLATVREVDAVFAEVQTAQSMGITGVPTFILGQRYGVIGAQSAETLAKTMRKAVAG